MLKPRIVAPGDRETPDLLAFLNAQREAFRAERPVSNDVRRDRLRRLLRLTVEGKDDIVDALRADFGGERSRKLAMLGEFVAKVQGIKQALHELDRWTRPEKRKANFPLNLLRARAEVLYQPKGVVGIITPWNVPFGLSVSPLTSVLAAGNRAMIKLSEFNPRFGEVFKALVQQHFAPEEVTVVTGGADVGAAFAALPFDHLLVTGSTEVGRHIMRAAADNLVPITLELGGKSPVIVGRATDRRLMAERIGFAKLLNGGQLCLSPDYALVPEESQAQFAADLIEAIGRMYPTIADNEDYTGAINDRHHARLLAHVEDARAKGADVVEINPSRDDLTARRTRKIAPTLILGATPDMTVMQEEIFGPILPVMTYRRLEDALAFVGSRPHPLGLYFFGSDTVEQTQILELTQSGGVTINDAMSHYLQEDLPFGGIGASGMGAYHGHDGFKTFSHPRAVFRQSPFDILKIVGAKPPLGTKLTRYLEKQIRM